MTKRPQFFMRSLKLTQWKESKSIYTSQEPMQKHDQGRDLVLKLQRWEVERLNSVVGPSIGHNQPFFCTSPGKIWTTWPWLKFFSSLLISHHVFLFCLAPFKHGINTSTSSKWSFEKKREFNIGSKACYYCSIVDKVMRLGAIFHIISWESLKFHKKKATVEIYPPDKPK